MLNYRITIESLNPEVDNDKTAVYESEGFFFLADMGDSQSVDLRHMSIADLANAVKKNKPLRDAAELALSPEKAFARMLNALIGGDDDDESADE